MNNNSITEYYGKYLLNIELHGTDYRDKFLITEFYLQTDTYVEAGPTDSEGWITNPGLKDTDGDGWNDYKEIFLKGTNPLSADTDGDGAWDAYDRDPLQDVMLNISAISGTTCNYLYRTPRLQMVIAFKLFGTGESYYIPTLKVWAHADPNEYGEYQTAYFDGTHGSDTELHYYANIDDDVRIQSNVIAFTLQLWRYRKISWDTKIVSGKDYYEIGQVGHFETVNVTKFKDDGKNEAKFKVETIGVEKANTIAIYEMNGTTFNGHYQEQERMNILQLNVTDSGVGTPFVEGPNVIVIPTSLFTETVFNAYVQNESLSETPIYSTDDEIFMFFIAFIYIYGLELFF